MKESGDTLILYMLIGAIFYFIYKRWIAPLFRDPKEPEPIQSVYGTIIKEKGYELIRPKETLAFSMEVDEHAYESRIYIDGIASKEDQYFLVVGAKNRKPIRFSGAAIRDTFLHYVLLFDVDGILYVDKHKREVRVITFELPEIERRSKKSSISIWPTVLLIILSVVLGWNYLI
ncbi:hypothetical protein IC620_12955 [Hazenella sp. IB182357]|uniref:Uncharacterized protein n=1 Tax=Polycladospora coralii TaxID=2771432 RepID=A0A926RUQ2_9BACL|nr:hypothetical protein [Polycladospora coralii]MBD1373258.1 hypothetical protein [Polycladospora coralii]MBS7530916.1 hypothetical protein [Polycladospora coralii]